MAKILLGCFRMGDANDPEIYADAVVAVLSDYPVDIVKRVVDPRIGLPSKAKWLPTIAEIKELCEEEYASTRRMAEADARAIQTANLLADRRVLLARCHCWLRAQQVGDQDAEKHLKHYSPEDIAEARLLSFEEVLNILPQMRDRVSRPLHKYRPFGSEVQASE